MKILLPLHGFIGWNGGLDLVRLISSALAHSSVAPDIKLHFALPEIPRSKEILLATMRRWHSMRAGAMFSNGGSTEGLRKIAIDISTDHPVITCRNSAAGIKEAAEAINADIIFPTMLPLGHSTTPRIGYLFDFQHRHLPHLFSRRTRWNRDRQFAKIAEDANGIVVNSQAVARDVTQFLGVSADRILVMPFTPYAHPWWFDIDSQDAQRRYGIYEPFLMVCNHFWTHKDHATALQAFTMLKYLPSNSKLHLVLTGDPIDHRDPRHYGRILDLCETLGITNSTHFLGLIPKRDQLGLLRKCSALLQPTLFEGGPGGGSVYESIGLGVPTIVSDIGINREINTGLVNFFCAGDPNDLAREINHVLSNQPTRLPKDQLLARSDERLSQLGKATVNYLKVFFASYVAMPQSDNTRL